MNDDTITTIIDISYSLSLILQRVVDDQFKSKELEIQLFLESQTYEELEILKHLSNFFKITPSNYKIIQQNSKYFSTLQQACILYEEIIGDADIQQKNFLNILVLHYLLTTITESKAYLYSIYANLFLTDIDIYSFYNIIFMHCFGIPNSIYEFCLFIKYCNDIQDNKKILKNFFLDLKVKYNSNYKWTIGTFGYFLYRFKLIEKTILINYYESYVIQLVNDNILMNEDYFNSLKNRTFSNPMLNLIINDDVDSFGRFVSINNVDLDAKIKKPKEITTINYTDDFFYNVSCLSSIIYWPFDEINNISIIEFCSFFGSLKVFKYLMLNHVDIDANLINYAIAGGNLEIIHICQQNKCQISLSTFEFAVRYYRTDIFAWLVDNNPIFVRKEINIILDYIIRYSNPQAFLIFYQNIIESSGLFLNRLDMVNREWIRFFINYDDFIYRFLDVHNKDCIKSLFSYKNFKNFKILLDEINGKIDLNISLNQIMELFDSKLINIYNLFISMQYFFKQKGELDKYDGELIFPPFPNHFVIGYLKNMIIISSDIKFIIFMSKNHYLDEYIDIEYLCYFALSTKNYEILDLIEKIDPKITRSLIFDKNWLSFFTKNEKLKSFYFDKCLLDNESNLDFQTEGLCYACSYGDLLSVEHLIKRKFIDVNSKKLMNKTPLNLAAENNFIKIVYILINDERVDLNSVSDDNETPFFSAVENNYIDLVDLLLKNKKIDINIPNKNGKTPFLIACINGYDKVVKKMLRRYDLNVNIIYKNKHPVNVIKEYNYGYKYPLSKLTIVKNPLQGACFNGYLKIVKILLSNKAINKNELDKISTIILTYKGALN